MTKIKTTFPLVDKTIPLDQHASGSEWSFPIDNCLPAPFKDFVMSPQVWEVVYF